MIILDQGIALLALFLTVAVIVALGVMTVRAKSSYQQLLKDQTAIQTDLRALCNAAVQMGERVNHTESELNIVQQRQQELGVRQDNMVQSETHEISFEQAIKLARKGSSVEELMEICDLSRGEAELVAMMHRLDPGA